MQPGSHRNRPIAPNWRGDSKQLSDFMPGNAVQPETGLVASRKREISADPASLPPLDKQAVIAAIQTVEDPEIPVNLYDLGLIYDIDCQDHHIDIKMTLTAPNCPVAGILPNQVADAIFQIENIQSLDIYLVFDPPWTKEMMSEDAQLALDLF